MPWEPARFGRLVGRLVERWVACFPARRPGQATGSQRQPLSRLRVPLMMRLSLRSSITSMSWHDRTFACRIQARAGARNVVR